MHIQTEKTTIPFYYNPSKFKQEMQKRNECNFSKLNPKQKLLKQIRIPPRTELFVTLPAVGKNGSKLTPKLKLNKNVIMPSAIVKLHNNWFKTSLINISNETQEINFYNPLVLEEYQTNTNNQPIQINNFDINNKSCIKNILNQNLENNLRLDHLNQEETTMLTNLCHQFKDIFYSPDIPLSATNLTKHHIRTKTDAPIFTKTYRYPHVHRNEVKQQINKMLNEKIIEPSESPYNFPIWVVPKKMDASGTQKWRIVIDYRKLNEQTIEDKYPLPRIETVLDNLGRATYFSTLDLASGFHQIEIEKEDREKTAFSTEEGHFQFRRMPFGLKNAPATFQRAINNALAGLTPQQCLVYLDDIIIYSKSLQEHINRLKNVFIKCRQANIKIQLDKSEFLHKSVKYLGHIITPDGVKPDPSKISAIKNFPVPKTRTEIKSFLGLFGYYRKFVKDFAKITKFLTVCLKKENKIIHTSEFLENFEYCKTLLTNEPLLQYPNFNKPFELTTDASKYALGAVLSQEGKPICYASRTLNDTEQKYTTIERELLAIVWATKQFRPYLFGVKFTLYTDHRPLVWLRNLKEPNSKLTRWALKLEEYDFTVTYLPGKLNKVADALSRIQIHPMTIEPPDRLNTPEPPTNNDSIMASRSSTPDIGEIFSTPTFILPEDNEPRCKIISNQLIRPPDNQIEENNESLDNDNDDSSLVDTVHTQHSSTPVIDITDKPLQYFKNQIEFLNANIPKNIRISKYDGITHYSVFVNNMNKEQIFNELLIEYCEPNTHYHCYFPDDTLYLDFSNYINNVTNENTPKFHRCMRQVTYIIKPEERQTQIQNYHFGKTNHRGITETIEHLKRKYYWKSINKDITNYINNCQTCKIQKYNRDPVKQPLQLTPTYARPFHTIHLDIFQISNRSYLTILDAFSKFAQAYPLRSHNLTDVIEQLLVYICTFTAPNEIIADGEFNKNIFKDFLAMHKIRLHVTTPHHHQSNSLIERLHSTLIEHYRLLNNTPEDKKMQYCILAYNHSIHSNLNLTPFEITFGHTDNKNPFDIDYTKTYYHDYLSQHKVKMKNLYEALQDKQTETKEKRNEKINPIRKTRNFKLQDKVFIKTNFRNKKEPKFVGPFIISKIFDHDTYELTPINKKGPPIKRHINELLPFSSQPPLQYSASSHLD